MSHSVLSCRSQNLASTIMVQFCYFRSLLRIETVTFPLILWAGRMDMDWNFGKLGQLFQSFNAMPQKTCSVPPLVKFAWYLFLNPTGAFCVWVSRCSSMLQLKVPLILWVALSGLYAANIEIKPYVIWSLKQVKTKKNRRQPRNVVTVAYESGRLQEVPTVLKSRGHLGLIVMHLFMRMHKVQRLISTGLR